MIMWVFAAIATLLIIWWVWVIWYDDYRFFDTWVGKAFSTLGVVLIVWPLLLTGIFFASGGLANIFTPYSHVKDSRNDLVAVKTKDTIEGKYAGSIFASYGYINGVRVLSYISRDDDGGMKLGYVKVSESVVYEGTDDPYIETHEFEKRNWFWLPEFIPFGSTRTYSLHVPTGTVVDGYEIAP